jgi:hypothetical protein
MTWILIRAIPAGAAAADAGRVMTILVPFRRALQSSNPTVLEECNYV